MNSRRGIFFAIANAYFIGGCATVPPLQEDGIAISEIVRRVKCELAFAVPEPEPPYPTGRYQWMSNWTAKVDLTLITNDQAAITPTVSFLTPMRPVTIPILGTFTRSFGFGVGGGVTTNALRNETLSFTLSMKELRAGKYRGDCDLPNGFNLYGNLGLKEWIASALTPVNQRQLTVGYHTAPGAKPPLAPAVSTARPANAKEELENAAIAADYYAKEAKKAADVVSNDTAKLDVQKAYDDARLVYGAAKEATKQVDKAKDAYRRAKTDPANTLADLDRLLKSATDSGADATSSKTAVAAMLEMLPHDPPIDSIGHQVQFIVVSTGNIAPNWSLVHFKGPAASGNLASLTDTRTHTLNIAMGSPSAPATPDRTASVEQLRQLNNLHLDTLRLSTP